MNSANNPRTQHGWRADLVPWR